MKVEVDPSKDALILAHGEVTGHFHGIKTGGIEVHEDFFSVKDAGASLTHQEHGTITLPPGDFDSGIVRETDHLNEEIRNVAD